MSMSRYLVKTKYTYEKIRQTDYVWLPFRFDGEMAYLDWQDEWRIEDYE